MKTPREFVEAFLHDKTAAWAVARPHLSAVHANYFGQPLLEHQERFLPRDTTSSGGKVVEVTEAGGAASVVVEQDFATAPIRTRYRLTQVHAAWRIIGIDLECPVCRVTPQVEGAPTCKDCNGEGWRVSQPIV